MQPSSPTPESCSQIVNLTPPHWDMTTWSHGSATTVTRSQSASKAPPPMAPASPDTYVTTTMPSSKYPDRIANYAEAKARATLSTLEAAARAALARHQLSEPKNGDGPIEAIRALRVARSSAVKAATASMNAIRSMLVTAPEHCAHTYADTARQLSSKPASRSNPTPPHWQIRPTPRASRYGYWRDGHANYAGKQKNSRNDSRYSSAQSRHEPRTCSDLDPTLQRHCSSPSETTRSGYGRSPPLLTSAAWHPSLHRQERQIGIDNTAAAIAVPTKPSTPLSPYACDTMRAPATTLNAARQKANP